MRIGAIELGERPLVVAEVGNNHEGDPETARELVRRVADAGADAVKLQTFTADDFVRPQDRRRHEQMRRFELSRAEVESIAALARELHLLFISTPLDMPSVDFLEPLVDAFKIASGDNDFVPLLDRVAASGKPLLISTGLLDLAGVEGLVRRVDAPGRLALLHAVTAYPSPPAQVNLAAMPALERHLGLPVGYSDHTLGAEACVLAAALGAKVLEKHVTLDHDFSDFRDHKLSATPDELSELVTRVGAARVLVGRPEKEVQAAERELAPAVRRAIVAAVDLPSDHKLTAADLTWMRPGDGLAPGQEASVLGRRVTVARTKGETIRTEDLE